MKKHIAFPSIGQFKDVVRQVRDNAKYHQVALPTILFQGGIKCHGSNGATVRPMNGSNDDIYFQSRERILDLLSDNAGFCAFGERNKEHFNALFDSIAKKYPDAIGSIQVYGEWMGSNIQKGVGLNYLPKMFNVFAIRISEDAESQKWFTTEQIIDVMAGFTTNEIRHVYEFPTFFVSIPFSNPESVQNILIDLTNEVERDCPVARTILGKDFDKELIGEGIVFKAVSCDVPEINIDGLMYKSKGAKHSVSKVKTLVPVDEEKMNSVQEFVDAVCTKNRLEQGIDVLKQRGLEIESKNTGEFIKFIVGDAIKEESNMMVQSGLCTKDVSSKIASVARQFWMEQL